MQQILVRIPGINVPIFGFGAMLFVAFLACTWVATRRARRVGIPAELIQDLAIWLFIGGLLGARIVFLTMDQRPASLVDFFWQLPRIWDGGIVLYGSILGGLVAYAGFYLYSLHFRKYRIPTLRLADVLAPTVALGIAIGRLGCFLNGCCYGQVPCAECAVYAVHFPLSAPPRYALVHAGYQTVAGFTLDEDQPNRFVKVGRVEPGSPAERVGLKAGDLIESADGEALSGGAESPAERLGEHFDAGWERGRNVLTLTVRDTSGQNPRELTFEPRTIGLHPTQLYETVSMCLLFLVLLAFDTVPHPEGMQSAVLMMGYAVHRALNELLRNDPRPVGLERYASYFLFAVGVALAAYVLVRGRRAATPPEPPAPSREVMPAGASGPA
jgi:prolipoprotein diacylglyceryltransferase